MYHNVSKVPDYASICLSWYLERLREMRNTVCDRPVFIANDIIEVFQLRDMELRLAEAAVNMKIVSPC